MQDKFITWNSLKIKLHNKKVKLHIKVGEIYFMSIGQNIGYEIYGKGNDFLRPVLVYKKLSKTTFIGIPLSSQTKEGSYFYNFSYKYNKTSTALFNQLKIFDSRRIVYFSGKIKTNDLNLLKEKVLKFMDITPQKGMGITSQKEKQRNMELSITENNEIVKKSINKRFLAIIPARGGSKRLPRKNILDLNGKPLIAYSVEAGLNSKYIDKVIVSSDDEEILNISKQFGADTIKRPNELATDTATSFDAIKHTIENTNKYDYIVLLQPTSPLRDEKHIDEAIELLEHKNADAVVSVCEMDHSPLWSNTLDDSLSMSNFLKDEVLNKRSQDLEVYYRLNGAIYICKTDKLLEEKSFFLKENIFAYKMDRKSSVDIDEEIDFKMAALLLKG